MKELCIYGHYGSGNHGNEAIIRGIATTIAPMHITLYSMNIDKDIEFGLDEICDIEKMIIPIKRYSFINILGAIQLRLSGKNTIRYRYMFKNMLQNAQDKLFILEMGDQYCEQDNVLEMYYYLNNKILKKHGKLIAMGGSVNEEQLDKQDVINDLKRYCLILVRESLTYNALKKKGINNIKLIPDPAFAMNALKCELPDIFNNIEIIGIVVGGVAQGYEKKGKNVIRCIEQFMEYILESTHYGIALIPHVRVGGVLDDVKTEKEIYSKFRQPNRIILIPEQRADCQKYIISKCKFLVTLRTHASIAAYSSGIPTLVLGYSIKSKGIALDLFGEYESYVIDINQENIGNTLIEKFNYLNNNYAFIKEKNYKNLSSYINRCNDQIEIFSQFLK